MRALRQEALSGSAVLTTPQPTAEQLPLSHEAASTAHVAAGHNGLPRSAANKRMPAADEVRLSAARVAQAGTAISARRRRLHSDGRPQRVSHAYQLDVSVASTMAPEWRASFWD